MDRANPQHEGYCCAKGSGSQTFRVAFKHVGPPKLHLAQTNDLRHQNLWHRRTITLGQERAATLDSLRQLASEAHKLLFTKMACSHELFWYCPLRTDFSVSFDRLSTRRDCRIREYR